MPVIIVAYSGGYMPAAYSLAQGGADDRIRGVVLFDALYGEEDKFAHWVEGARSSAFFVSAYSSSSRDQNVSLRARLQRDGVAVQSGLPDGLRPGVVAFVDFGRRPARGFRQRRLDQRSACATFSRASNDERRLVRQFCGTSSAAMRSRAAATPAESARA